MLKAIRWLTGMFGDGGGIRRIDAPADMGGEPLRSHLHADGGQAAQTVEDDQRGIVVQHIVIARSGIRTILDHAGDVLVDDAINRAALAGEQDGGRIEAAAACGLHEERAAAGTAVAEDFRGLIESGAE